MTTPIDQLNAAFRAAIRQAFGREADPVITVAQRPELGDYQSNAAMGLAKTLSASGSKANPRAVADSVIENLQLGEMAAEVTVAGPGFINVRLAPAWIQKELNASFASARLGIDAISRPQRVVVDYSGPNIAKQMHVGHLRSTIIGDAISRVLEFHGHDVIRQNHIGDWGTQFGMLITHLKRMGDTENYHIEDLEAFYRAAKKRFDEEPEFQDESREHVVMLQGGDPQVLHLWRRIVEETRKHNQPIYEVLSVKLRGEDERGESFYNPMLENVVEELSSKGVAAESEGAMAIFVDGFPAPLLVRKSDGGYLYATTDLAAVKFRIQQLGAERIIYVHDSRQAQHFAQVFEAARRVGWAGQEVSLEFAPFGTMLGADGRPFKTKTGGTVKLRDLLEEAEQRAYAVVNEKNPALDEQHRRQVARAVGVGAVKYSDLSKDRVADYAFVWDKMLAMEGNTAPYLQYAYARICSILRKTSGPHEIGAEVTVDAPQELALGKHILRLGEVLQIVGRELKPHHLCGYLYELASRYSSFYENCPVLHSTEPTRSRRLALCQLSARTLALGLDLLGIAHPEQM